MKSIYARAMEGIRVSEGGNPPDGGGCRDHVVTDCSADRGAQSDRAEGV